MRFYQTGKLVSVAAVLAFSGCAKGEGAAGAPSAAKSVAEVTVEAKTVSAYFPIKIGEKETRLQIALTVPEMQRGLMGRAFIGADEGMVFLYEKPQRMNFWMRNTPSPLDIGFFRADGTLGEVYPLYPFDETPVGSAGEDYTLAVEMNQGWFAKNGLAPGAKLDLRALAVAVRARGFKPEKFGLPLE